MQAPVFPRSQNLPRYLSLYAFSGSSLLQLLYEIFPPVTPHASPGKIPPPIYARVPLPRTNVPPNRCENHLFIGPAPPREAISNLFPPLRPCSAPFQQDDHCVLLHHLWQLHLPLTLFHLPNRESLHPLLEFFPALQYSLQIPPSDQMAGVVSPILQFSAPFPGTSVLRPVREKTLIPPTAFTELVPNTLLTLPLNTVRRIPRLGHAPKPFTPPPRSRFEGVRFLPIFLDDPH